MVSLFKSDLNSVCIFLMIEKALSESALLFGNTNNVFASFERTPNLFVSEKMSSSVQGNEGDKLDFQV